MNKIIDQIKSQLLESAEVKKKVADSLSQEIAEIARMCARTIREGGKIMFCGNGGSAADSQHLATELVVRLTASRNRRALPALALTTDTSILTAGANDFGFDEVFVRQLQALGRKGDVLIAISTSGNSGNIIKAVQEARDRGILAVGFLGGDGGKLAGLVDKSIIVPSNDVQRIQESHITIGHIIISLIEDEIC
jgi:D-sedoheptulose 7-phosphate isomerase